MSENKPALFNDAAVLLDSNGQFTTGEIMYTLPGSDNPQGYGRPVSPEAAMKMLSTKIIEKFSALKGKQTQEIIDAINQSEDSFAVDFGSNTLLDILMQEGCNGIRFVFCKNMDGKDSVIAVGLTTALDQNGARTQVAIKKDAFNKKATLENLPILKEQGIGKKIKEIIIETGSDINQIAEKIRLGSDIQELEETIRPLKNNIFGAL